MKAMKCFVPLLYSVVSVGKYIHITVQRLASVLRLLRFSSQQTNKQSHTAKLKVHFTDYCGFQTKGHTGEAPPPPSIFNYKSKVQKNTKAVKLLGKKNKLLKLIIYKNRHSHRKTMQEAHSDFHKAKILLKDLHSNSKNNNNKICTSTSCTTV